jgi:hypothetical protein
MFLYIPCIYPDHFYCNCPYNIKDVNTCAYISTTALLLHPDRQTFIENLYTTKSKSLALLNLKHSSNLISIISKFILNIEYPCPLNKLKLSEILKHQPNFLTKYNKKD